MDRYKTRIFFDSHEKRPYKQDDKKMIHKKKCECRHVSPWMQVDYQKFDEGEVEKEDDSTNKYKETIRKFLSYLLDHRLIFLLI